MGRQPLKSAASPANSTGPTGGPTAAAQVPITSFRFFHPLTGMTHMSVNSSLSPSFPPSPRIRAAPGDPRRGRALGMGRTPRPAGLHAEGPVRAHARESNPAPGRDFPFYPRAARPCILAGTEGAGAASAAQPVQDGADWGFHPDVRGTRLQRQGKAATRAPKTPTPLGFSLSSSLVSTP
jgi:hypothetical protein